MEHMNDKQLKKIQETVATSINVNVNGKINVLTRKFDEYVEGDLAWKKKYEPYLEGLANLSGGAKIIIWIVMAVGAIFGTLLSIKSYFLK